MGIKEIHAKDEKLTKGRVGYSGTNMRFDTVLVFTVFTLFARVITEDDATLGSSDGRGMRPSALFIGAFQTKLA